MKKSLLLILPVLVLAACKTNKNSEKGDVSLFSNEQQVIALEAISGVEMINESSKEEKVATTSTSDSLLDTLRGNADVEKYINMFDGVMKNGGPTYVVSDSNLEGYSKMMVITRTSISGEETSYELHYNEVLLGQEDDEIEYSINGLLVSGEISYEVTGNREVEEDEEEFVFSIQYNETSKLVINQEIENNEMEFEYTLYENNVVVSKEEIEIENESGELSVKVKNKGITGKEYFKFKVSETKITIKYGIENGTEFVCYYTLEDGLHIENNDTSNMNN